MAYRLSTGDEPVSRQLHQILLEQIDGAARRLGRATPENRDEQIHEARKDIKKIRALLRLLAHQLGKARFRIENHRFRDIGRKLSQLRDAQAMIESVEALPEGTLPARARSGFVKRLEAEKARLYQSVEVDQVLASAVADLQSARPEAEKFAFKGQGFRAIEPGLLSMYRQGRQAWKQARETGLPEDLHNLRKRVKDHGYQLRLLAGFDSEAAAARSRQEMVRELETVLGDAHNLHVMEQTMLVGKKSQTVSAVLAEREKDLNAQAFALAAVLYQDKTRQFRKHLGTFKEVLDAMERPRLEHKPPARELTAAKPPMSADAVNA